MPADHNRQSKQLDEAPGAGVRDRGRDLDIPLPALTAIDWGQAADPETRGRIELKLKLEAK